MTAERGSLTEWQIRRILNAVSQDRIEAKQGLSYVPQQEVRAELTRTFGAGNWDSHVHDQKMLYETSQPGTGTKSDKTYWVVAYSCAVTLRIRSYEGLPIAEFTEYHAEENAPQPNRGEAHVLAMTSASSYALRRAAIGIGDNMGLHLYNKGSLSPIILGTGQLSDPEGPHFQAIQARKKAAHEAAAAAAQVSPGPQAAVTAAVSAPAPTDADNAPFAATDAAQAAAGSAIAGAFNHPEGRQA
jgi:hypothetical protein